MYDRYTLVCVHAMTGQVPPVGSLLLLGRRAGAASDLADHTANFANVTMAYEPSAIFSARVEPGSNRLDLGAFPPIGGAFPPPQKGPISGHAKRRTPIPS